LDASSHDERRRELAERLPDAVFQALRDGHAGDDWRVVRRRATRLLETDSVPRRQYRQRKSGVGSSGYDSAAQPWPVPPQTYDPARTVLRLLSGGTPPDAIDVALRSLGMGTYEETVARIRHWNPKLRSELEESLSRRTWDSFGEFDGLVRHEETEVPLRTEILDPEMTNVVAEWMRRFGLSPREAEVSALRASGMAPVDIARRLGTASSTVRAQLTAVRKKVHSRA
jgi:DNA-binding CsgD family transcriptional regulator